MFLIVAISCVAAQTPDAKVPGYVRYSGTLADAQGKPLSGQIETTFALYADETGGEPLWSETQSVGLQSAGRYTVLLGASREEGIPAEVFAGNNPRWLSISAAGHAPEKRVRLTSIIYALKSADTESLGGRPAAEYVLKSELAGAQAAAPLLQPEVSAATSGSGTANQIAKFTGTSVLGDSIITESSGNVGVGTPSPTAKFEVAGTLKTAGAATLKGVEVPEVAAATASQGGASYPLSLTGAVFDAALGASVLQRFQWEVEATGNNTALAGSRLKLGFGANGAVLSDTGLSIGNDGKFTFAAGQAFPGTLSALNAGSGLTGTTSNGVAELALDTAFTDARYALSTAAVGGSGNAGFIPRFTDSNALGNSSIFENNGNIGIGVSTPSRRLQVAGNAALFSSSSVQLELSGPFSGGRLGKDQLGMFLSADSPNMPIRFYTQNNGLKEVLRLTSAGEAQLQARGVATEAEGQPSAAWDMLASVFDSANSAARKQQFRWLAEPVNNNSPEATSRLSLQFGSVSSPTNTGFSFNPDGTINFAPGQEYPGSVEINSGTSGINANGSEGSLPRFDGASSLTESSVFESNGFVGIGTKTPAAKLSVNGNLMLQGSVNHYLQIAGESSAARLGQDSVGPFLASDTPGKNLRLATTSSSGLRDWLSINSKGQTSFSTADQQNGQVVIGPSSAETYPAHSGQAGEQMTFRLSRAPKVRCPDPNVPSDLGEPPGACDLSQPNARDFIIAPYKYGMGIHYPSVIEIWSKHLSVHNHTQNCVGENWKSANTCDASAQFWVGNGSDSGGFFVTAHESTNADGTPNSAGSFAVIAADRFDHQSHGSLHLQVRETTDAFRFQVGPWNVTEPNSQPPTVASISGVGVGSFTGGIKVGAAEAAVASIDGGGVGSFTGGLKLGAAGTTITNHISATATLTFADVAASSCSVQTLQATGAADGDTVALGIPGTMASAGSLTFFGWVSAADTVSVRVCNPTSSAITAIPSATVRVDVWKH